MQAKKGKREARMAGVVRMAALLAVLCMSAAALGYSFREDFSVSDDVGESYGLDIEQMSH